MSKKGPSILAVPKTEKMNENLLRIQAERQLKDKVRTSIKKLAQEILENAKG